jgi:biofilm PGA synthesis lipoprotein PgaB
MRLLPLLLFVALPALAGEPAFRAISYHDVQDVVAGDYDPDQYAVSTGNLIDQFTWLRDQGFNPVSIDQLVAAQEGRAQLPDKAVLLTFDDGLVSVYTRVFPLLKLFDYPAVVSIVTSWIEMEGSVDYAGRQRGADEFLNWDQIRELQASGLVEIASHTHDLHEGIRGNPQRNLQPAAVTRIYSDTGYESESDYLSRIEADLVQSVAIITEKTGRSPRVITWPYGKYNEAVASLAARHGMNIDLTLTPDLHSTRPAGAHIVGRHLVNANPKLEDFSADLILGPRPPIVRVAQVDLDYVFDTDPVAQKANLDSLLDRIKALQISHVFLQAFSDDDADGGADAVYFPNRHLPVKADLFNRVAWQLKSRAEVQVFAWLPMLSFAGSAFDPKWRVLEYRDDMTATDADAEPRLSPSSAAARSRILEVYEDLATYTHFDGLLFHDDGRLNEFEDYSPAAMHQYRVEFGTDVSPQILPVDPELRRRLIELKARTLLDLSTELLERVREYRPGIKSARNIFASALLDDPGTEYLAQDFDAYLRVYDYVALMAMPAHEGADDPERFYKQLVDQVRRRESGLERTIFELQTIDWSRSRPIPASELRGTMRWLQSLGVRHLGYYPDDFITGHPDVEQLRLGISLAEDLMGAVTP